MAQRVLVIEDDRRIARWVQVYFQREGFDTQVAHDGERGLELARELAPDLVVLDLMLPGLDGRDVCRLLRGESDVPIIMLTALGEARDRIDGLEGGADDYVVKPFDPAELVARARAVLRRADGAVRRRMVCGELVLDTTRRRVTLAGELLLLTGALTSLLAVFMRCPNQTLSREQLIAGAFGADYAASDRTIDTHVRRLRRAIHHPGYAPIETVYGVGYRLCCEEG